MTVEGSVGVYKYNLNLAVREIQSELAALRRPGTEVESGVMLRWISRL